MPALAVQGALTMQAFQSMAIKNNLPRIKIFSQWQVVLIAFGGILTLAWLGLLIWYLLRLLQLL